MALFDEYESEEYESGKDDKNRLFETQLRTTRSARGYLKLLLIVVVIVIVAGGLIFYFTLPGVGDAVKAPQGLEDAVRSHFLDKEKRTMTDESVFYCGGFYWVKVDVEKRPDIVGKPNSNVSTYIGKATQQPDGTWAITATPVVDDENGGPCS